MSGVWVRVRIYVKSRSGKVIERGLVRSGKMIERGLKLPYILIRKPVLKIATMIEFLKN